MIVEHAAPDLEGRFRRIEPPRRGDELGFGLPQLALADCEQRRRRQVDQLFRAIPRFDVGRADRVRACGGRRARKHVGLERRGVGIDCTSRGRRRAAQARLQSGVADAGEGERQMRAEQIRRAPQHGDPALDEHARRRADVLARGRDQPRHGAQLGRGLRQPLRGRRRLHRHQVVDAVGDRGRVDHRIARPRPDRVEIQQPAVDDAQQDPPIDPLVGGERRGVERLEPRSVRAQPRRFGRNRARREVLERIVVTVQAVARGDRRVPTGELIEVLVHQRRERAAGWRDRDRRRRGGRRHQ